jgi:iron complex outermembrane receptor protein
MKSGGYLPALGLGLLIFGLNATAVAEDDGASANNPASAAAGAHADSLPALEQVTVYAPFNEAGVSLGGTTVTQGEMRQFNRDTLDRAFVLASGTSVSMVGARNETDIWVRGFDRWRVPLYQDGIPVFLPYDDRIDFSRFSTIDLASIQISKGFASVIDGPGAMGGAVNLVSRVVQKELEAEARYQDTLDSHGSHAESIADVFLGTRQSNWFIQGAGSFDRRSHFRLSDDFTPGTLQGPGNRIDSFHQDYKINLKAGFDPSPGTDYSINYIDQRGRKDNTPPDSLIPPSLMNAVKYWTWPAWNKKSLYWLSQNALDDSGSYVKVRLYYDRFFNQLDSYDSLAYNTQNTPKSFNSTYYDKAAGGSAELSETVAGGADTIRVATHYRWDQHNETESTRNAPFAPMYQQPWETAEETTYSVALENIYRPTRDWQLIAGMSYDSRHLIGDSEWVSQGTSPPFGHSFAYPVADKHALNGEIAAIYSYSADGSVHISYADRSRFPTLFEMYSTRFGTFINNPTLRPERSHYTQIGIADTILDTRVVVNAFVAKITNAITSVAISPTVSESENVGSARHQGFEIELSRKILPTLDGGVNFSDLIRVELSGGAIQTDTPGQKLFAYLDWHPLPQVSVVPNVDMESKRWLQNAVNNLIYYRGGSFTLVGLKASYQPTDPFTIELGVTNLLDRDYVIEDGYNGPGREYFLNLRVNY